MSAYRDFDAATDALNLGAARYLKKPINLKELREVIGSLAK
jgi:YesN/AraC family two-component response regulator